MLGRRVITYTLLCGYVPFRATETQELIDECSTARIELYADSSQLGMTVTT